MSNPQLKRQRVILQTIVGKTVELSTEPRWLEAKIMSLIGNTLGLNITYDSYNFSVVNYDDNNILVIVDINYSEIPLHK